MKQHARDYCYDYLRAFSAIMIVICHICQGYGISLELGYYLGGTYVDVFLLLSAYLLGISSRDKICSHPLQFLKKRTQRLIPTYYMFLTLSFIIIFIFIGYDALSIKQVFGHYLFLNWFWNSSQVYSSPLPQLGHLWFMSCIMFSYILMLVISQILRKMPTLNIRKNWIIFFGVVAMLATIATLKVRFMVYPFTVLLAFTLLFFRGREIMSRIRRINSVTLIVLLVIGNICGILYYLLGGYGYPVAIFWINLVNACLWIATAPIIFSTTRISRSILFISTISFEIYLIHHPFCLGEYSLKHYMPVWLASICVFAISIIGGMILSLITSNILKFYHYVFTKNPVA